MRLKIKPIFSLMFFLTIIYACNNINDKKGRYLALDSYLNEFLSDKNEIIQNPNQYFILIPSLNCRGCVNKGLQILDKLVSKEDENLILIHTKNIIIPKSLKNKIQIINDRNCIMDNYNLHLESINIFTKKDERFIDVKRYSVKNIDSLNQFSF